MSGKGSFNTYCEQKGTQSQSYSYHAILSPNLILSAICGFLSLSSAITSTSYSCLLFQLFVEDPQDFPFSLPLPSISMPLLFTCLTLLHFHLLPLPLYHPLLAFPFLFLFTMPLPFPPPAFHSPPQNNKVTTCFLLPYQNSLISIPLFLHMNHNVQELYEWALWCTLLGGTMGYVKQEIS